MADQDVQDCHLQVNKTVEIVGKVTDSLSLRVLAVTEFGDVGEFCVLLDWG